MRICHIPAIGCSVTIVVHTCAPPKKCCHCEVSALKRRGLAMTALILFVMCSNPAEGGCDCKRKVFLKNVTALSHNPCGAVMTMPYRWRVISFPFPENEITHFSWNLYFSSSSYTLSISPTLQAWA